MVFIRLKSAHSNSLHFGIMVMLYAVSIVGVKLPAGAFIGSYVIVNSTAGQHLVKFGSTVRISSVPAFR